MNYRQKLKEYKRIIVKIGTTSLTYNNSKLNLKRIEQLCMVLSDLVNQEKEIILISSGAIAVGTERLGLYERPRDIIGKQATSAVGQAILMQIYENFFMNYNQKVAQVLLTRDVITDDTKSINARNTLNRLLEMGVIPIINENDTVSTDEVEGFSDNDTLSAYVSNLIQGELLIILSDIDGLYTSDPFKNSDAKKINVVDEMSEEILKLAGVSSSKLGTGGMVTKIKASQIAVYENKNFKTDMVIAKGENPKDLFEIINGDDIGTLFTKK